MPPTPFDDSESGTTLSNERDRLIVPLLRRYGNHPTVRRAVHNQRKSIDTKHREHLDTVSAYLGEAGAYALLSETDEQELFGYIEDGMENLQQEPDHSHWTEVQTAAAIKLVAAHQVIVLTNLRLVVGVAKRFWNVSSLTPVDLIQEGNAGLAMAVRRFDISRGFMFSTYAIPWIRQAMTRAIADQSRIIRTPVHVHEQYLKIKKQVDKHANELDRELSRAEIEQVTGMDIDKYHALMRAGAPNLPSTDQAINGDSDAVLNEILDDGVDYVDNAITALSERHELRDMLEAANIDDRTRVVLGLRFGLGEEVIGNLEIEPGNGQTISYGRVLRQANTTDCLTLGEIGGILGISRERVRQIQTMGLKKLQAVALGTASEEDVWSQQ